MTKPGVFAHLWILLLIQIFFWATPSVLAGSTTLSTTATTAFSPTSTTTDAATVMTAPTTTETATEEMKTTTMSESASTTTTAEIMTTMEESAATTITAAEMIPTTTMAESEAATTTAAAEVITTTMAESAATTTTAAEMITTTAESAAAATTSAAEMITTTMAESATATTTAAEMTTTTTTTTAESAATTATPTTTSVTTTTTTATTTTAVDAGKNCSVGDQCVQFANCTSGVCQCDADHYDKTGICEPRLEVGEGCSGPSDTNCVSGSSCVAVSENVDQCRLSAGSGDCGSDDNKCVTNAVCQSDTCRIKAGFTGCGSNSTKCVSSATCESDTCKLKEGVSGCNSSVPCENKADCQSGTCRIKAGSTGCGSDSNKCVSSATCESGTCRLKVGQGCSGTNDNRCTSNAQCVAIGNSYQCRKKYGEQCDADSECSTSQRQTCVAVTSGGKYCLCNDQSFRLSSQCQDVTTLKATNLEMSGTHQETSISVRWTRPATSASVQYKAQLSTGQSSPLGTNTSTFTFTGLTQGTAFTFNVTSKTARNPGYRTAEAQRYTTVNSETANIYTKPALPGPLQDTLLPGPNVTVTFTSSAGHVDTYRVTVTPKKGGASKTRENSRPSVTIEGLTAGEYYDVVITAISNSINSEGRTGSFRVQAKPSDKVSGLAIEQKGSRWVQLKWTKPANPNGMISGYTVKSELDDMSCFSGVALLCSDCSYNSSQVTPNVSSCTYSDLMTLTRAQMDEPSFQVRVNVTQLMPAVLYRIVVTPFNEEGPGTPDRDQAPTTDPEAAAHLETLTARAGAIGELLVSWTPGERRGKTTYNVTWQQETSLSSNIFSPVRSTTLQGYNTSSYTITGLLSYWNYRVTVSTSTTVGPAVDTATISRTAESTPAQVENLRLTPNADDATKVTMTFDCPEERKRNGNLVKFAYNSTDLTTQGEGPKGEIPVSANVCSFSQGLTVTAETNYTVSVYAVTDSGLKGQVSTSEVSVGAKAPMFLAKPAAEFLQPTEKKTESSVTLDIQPEVVGAFQGRVVTAGLLVCRQSCQRGSSSGQKAEYYDNPSWIGTWGRNRQKGFYRATPMDWHLATAGASAGRKRRSAWSRAEREKRSTGTFQFTIGSNASCVDQSADFCNGPLEPGQEYHILVFSCTKGGCSESTEPMKVTTQAEDKFPIGPVVGAVVAVVVAAVVIVVVIVVVRRRHHKKPQTTEDISYDRMAKPLEINHVRSPIKLGDFAQHLERLHKDSNLQFQGEFEDITESSPKFPMEAATLDANKVKNRYVNILPFDRTRVKLNTDEDDATADYINASYIPGYSSPREYIATQGPMTGTVSDFWRMIWEQNSFLIVQLSDLQEKGRPKVDLYWPQEPNTPVQYGDIIITMTSMSTLNKYTIRNFTICMENNMEERRQVAQYFIHGWVDYSANLNPDDVMDFIRTVRLEAKRNPAKPITVHCSAGVGRTGTFIALDFLQQFVDDHTLDDVVDIYNLVLNMRHNRPSMVQSESQYVFIHDTLKLIVDRKIEMMKEEEENIYQNTGPDAEENIYANQGFEMEENIYQNTGFSKTDPTTSL